MRARGLELKRASLLLAVVISTGPMPAASQGSREERARSAGALVEQGRLEEAEIAYLALVAEEPDESSHYLGLLRVSALRSRPARALLVVLPAAERWLDAGEYSRAEEVLASAAESNPASARCLGLLGRSRALGRRFRAAEEPLRTAVELGERDLRTLLLLGSTPWENGVPDEAEEQRSR